VQVILEGGELWLFAQTKWAVLLIQAAFQGEGERIFGDSKGSEQWGGN